MAKTMILLVWVISFFVVVKSHQKSMYEFSKKSAVLPSLLKKRFNFPDFLKAMLRACPIKKVKKSKSKYIALVWTKAMFVRE